VPVPNGTALTSSHPAAELLDGFILTRQWLETSAGLELVFWLASDRGAIRFRLINNEVVCFFPTEEESRVRRILSAQSGWSIRPTELKNFAHQIVSSLYCASQRRLLDCRDRLNSAGIPVHEADIKPTDRFLMERFITGGIRLRGQLQKQRNFSEIIAEKVETSSYRPTLASLSIDIETDYAAETLYSIALYGNNVATVIMCGDTTVEEIPLDENCSIQLHLVPDERALLQNFVQEINAHDPDVLIGWNVVNFDLLCLQKFCDRAGVEFNIGRDASPPRWRQSRDSAERHYVLIPGRAVLDGIELMRTATYQFENFSLEYVAQQILQRGKLIDDVDQRGQEITELFLTDKPALARYNLEDCRLVWDIFSKENLWDFAVERSSLTGLELDRYGGSVAALDYLYLPRLHRHGYVAPSLQDVKVEGISPGGYVLQSLPGIHDNVIVLDFKSLYPSIIRTFHVDPLALVRGLQEENSIEGYDGARFSRQEFILPTLIENLWDARDMAKSSSNTVLSQAIKIIMNSFYGVLGTKGCRFFDSRLVSSITKRGHEIILSTKQQIESNGYQVIYGDTDSVFVLLGDVPEQDVAAIGKALAEKLNNWWHEEISQKHATQSFLEIEFETHFRRFLMPTIRGSEAGSKKRYAGLVANAQGQGERLMFKGLETVRSDWSPLARAFQQRLYEKIFADEPYVEYIKHVVQELLDGRYAAELVLRKRLRRKLEDYVKNVPPHVQAARKAEAYRAAHNLPSLYSSGGWVEYVMTVSGPEPRMYQSSQIDYDFYIDKQLTPIADSILVFKSISMDKILNKQIGLF